MIYTIRVTSGREDIVVDMLSSKIKKDNLPIKALFHPAEIKGYIFVEGSSGAVQKTIQGVLHVRGLIEKPIKLQDIQYLLEYKKERIKVGIDDIVELIGGPFRKEKGKIQRIDKVKDEVTVELLEASIPIPVTIATEFVKVIKHAKKPETEIVKEAPKPKEAQLPETEEKSILEKAMEEEAEELDKRKHGEPASTEEKPILQEIEEPEETSEEKTKEVEEETQPEEPKEKSLLEKLKQEAEEEKKQEIESEKSSEPVSDNTLEEPAKEEQTGQKSLIDELEEKESKKKKKKRDEEELE